MATVRNLLNEELDRVVDHSEVEAKIRLIEHNGEKFVQIDTFGAVGRKMTGKQSQSIRLSHEAFRQPVALGMKHF